MEKIHSCAKPAWGRLVLFLSLSSARSSPSNSRFIPLHSVRIFPKLVAVSGSRKAVNVGIKVAFPFLWAGCTEAFGTHAVECGPMPLGINDLWEIKKSLGMRGGRGEGPSLSRTIPDRDHLSYYCPGRVFKSSVHTPRGPHSYFTTFFSKHYLHWPENTWLKSKKKKRSCEKWKSMEPYSASCEVQTVSSLNTFTFCFFPGFKNRSTS